MSIMALDLTGYDLTTFDLATPVDLVSLPRPDLRGVDLLALCQQSLGPAAPLPWVKQSPAVPVADLLGAWALASNDAWFVGRMGAIYHSVDGGVNLQQQVTQFTATFNAVWGAAANDIYVAGSGGFIMRSSGNGKWFGLVTGVLTDLYGLWGPAGNDVYAVGASGMILRSSGNGQWSKETSGTKEVLRAVWGSGPGDVWAVGTAGTILHSTGNGMWMAQGLGVGNPPDLLAVWGGRGQRHLRGRHQRRHLPLDGERDVDAAGERHQHQRHRAARPRRQRHLRRQRRR